MTGHLDLIKPAELMHKLKTDDHMNITDYLEGLIRANFEAYKASKGVV